MLDQQGFVDVWRSQIARSRDYTFFPEHHQVHTLIDFILISKQDAHKVSDANIGLKIYSDHAWVECAFYLFCIIIYFILFWEKLYVVIK